jgi:hypothetical protein
VNLPVDWPDFLKNLDRDASFAGTIYLLRTFHAPTNLNAGQTVALRFAELRQETHVYLNGELLRFVARAQGVASREDITAKLLETNRLEVCWQVSESAALGPFNGAALEIL